MQYQETRHELSLVAPVVIVRVAMLRGAASREAVEVEEATQ
jgi:hypothetical protein